jgi:hypothetical protein
MDTFTVQVFRIIAGLYFLLAYLFLSIGYFQYLFENHPWQEKFIETTIFVLTPFFLPILPVLMLGKTLAQMAAGLLIVLLFTLVWALHCINLYFPFGGVFKAWLAAAKWIFKQARKLLSDLGLLRMPGLSPAQLSRVGL